MIDLTATYFFLVTEVRKVLSKISKEKGFEELADWLKPCVNHLQWSAMSTYDGNGMVILAKFKAFMSHVINKHAGLEDVLFDRCAHGDIEPRRWLKKGMSEILNLLSPN